MPALVTPRTEPSSILNQMIASPSDADYLDQLTPSIREYTYGNKTSLLLQVLTDYASARDFDIEQMCNTNHSEFVDSVNQLLRIREGTVRLTNDILELNGSIQASTEKLAEQKRALVESRGVRQNIDEAGHALQDCLEVLRLSNQVHDLLAKKSHYAALRALDELQNVHIRGVTQYKISEMIQKSVPATQKLIGDAVMADLNTWLFRIRESSQYLGELALYHTDLRKQRQQERADSLPYLSQFKLHSAIELVSDEKEEFDLLHTDELDVDFTPLFEALHIHQSLGQMDKFRSEYASTRRKQKELLLPSSISLAEEEMPDLHALLEEVAGYAIVERSTMKKVPDLRSQVDVDEIWDSLCQTAVSIISKALSQVDNAEHLLKIKNLIALFMQTMDTWQFPCGAFNGFLLTLFDKYAELLKERFSDDFLEIVQTDDYMPMPIQNTEEFEKVINVSWYTPDQPIAETAFPCVLPFSQMYPLCCIDIRNFLNQFYFFSTDSFRHPDIVDSRLQASLDDLLSTKVCGSLVAKLSSQYLGQIVQILINLEHFEIACIELESLLVAARSSPNDASHIPISLGATKQFRDNKKTAEKRIFELVNSKIDDLIDSAEYDWTPLQKPTEPSTYIQTLTQYLSNIMNSVLLSLPTPIKELMLFNAISHTTESILALPQAPEVSKINPNGTSQLAIDTKFLSSFVESLKNPILLENLDELQQTVALMQTDNTDEFFDSQLRNKKYGRVDPMKGPQLLEKLVPLDVVPEAAAGRTSGGIGQQRDLRHDAAERFAAFSSRFGRSGH